MNKRGQYFALAMIIVLVIVFSWASPFSRIIKFEKEDEKREFFDNFADEIPFVVNTAVINKDPLRIDAYIADYSEYLELKGIEMRTFYIVSSGNQSKVKNSLQNDSIFVYPLYNLTINKSTERVLVRGGEEYIFIGTEKYYFNLAKEPSVNIVAKLTQGGRTETYVYES